MKKDKLIIVGDSAFAEIAYEYFTYESDYEVVAFSVEKAYLKRNELFGVPIVPFEDLEERYSPEKYKVFVALTYLQLNRVRTRLYKEAKAKGFTTISYISPRAFVWRNVEIGENCFIFEGNVIQSFVKIGNNVILWSGNHIGHHSIIKDNCFISSHVVVSGFVEIGENCFLGVNSCIIDRRKIARDCVIGAGAVVLQDSEEGKVYVGNPARPLEKSSYGSFKVNEA
ncbi:MAG: acetyltransferase [Candidatus Bathyarchaeota archaeon]|nr:acetyltransferase [Candidatus Bathyarchaeota archaeon]